MKIRDKIVIKNLLKAGDYEGIIKEVDSLLQEEKNSYLFYMKAQALFNCGRYNQSLDAIRKSFEYPDAGNELLLLAGRLYFQLNYYRKAEEFYIHSLKLRGDCTETIASYSFLLFITGFLDKAYIMLDRAREKEEFNIYTMTAEAKISLYSAGYKKESHLMEKILSRTSGDSFDIINSALILRLNKNRKEAQRLLKKLLTQDEKNSDLIFALIRLTKIPPYHRIKTKNNSSLVQTGLIGALVISAIILLMYQFGILDSAIILSSVIAVSALVYICVLTFKILKSKDNKGET